MGTQPDDAGRAGRPRRPRSARRGPGRRRLLRAVVIGLAAVVLLTGAGLTALYVKLDGNLSQVDIDSALGPDRPRDTPGGSMDILVLGSDSRAGTNGDFGGPDAQDGARSDTAMIVHVNEAHDAATVVSIPRDTLVDRPRCERGDGSTEPAADRSMFNEAYTVGGPACTVKTVESLTGLRMDHYLEVDFDGFARLVDTLGGVEITTTEAIDDEDSHLDLPAGTHTLDGRESLALVRTRKAVGDGSDLSRIELQQSFLRALADQAGGVGLASPKRLYDLADAATSAVTTDSGIGSVRELADLAQTLEGIGPDAMQMVTLPVGTDPADPNRVTPLPEQSGQVWRALRRDEPVPASAVEGSVSEENGDRSVVTEG
ncbi:LCP family protein [Streptomyces sp. MP131-18]|uniref:LCP family protein n=1 Tax=Streptomyces sp. MP131-18 TaxID=1857892 RepID=UPI00097BAB7E|nr:LCP family protein [Streptomyces sp. MP131-18]ONK11184.1 putative transcriptional regulator YwtF [Streptomyces sp. MP131-18]